MGPWTSNPGEKRSLDLTITSTLEVWRPSDSEANKDCRERMFSLSQLAYTPGGQGQRLPYPFNRQLLRALEYQTACHFRRRSQVYPAVKVDISCSLELLCCVLLLRQQQQQRAYIVRYSELFEFRSQKFTPGNGPLDTAAADNCCV